MSRNAWADRQKADLCAYVRALKQNPCTDCGIMYPYPAMDFDHCRGVKDMDISKMCRRPVTWERLLEELAKCDLVCANCHRIRTWQREARSADPCSPTRTSAA